MTTATVPQTKTFRAPSLAEALAQVREELGPDAVVVRRREGLEGGVAGFFQKAVIEVDAHAGGSSLDVRDDDAPAMPDAPLADGAPAAAGAAATVADAGPTLADAAPTLAREAAAAGFAAALATAQGSAASAREEAPAAPHRTPAARPHTDPAVDAIPQPRDSAPEVVPVVSARAPALTTTPHAEEERVLAALRRAGFSEPFAAAVVEEAAVHGLPFVDGDQPAALRPFVARALARRLDVAPLAGPGAIAVVGAGGSGKTAVVARLARAYAAAGRLPVAVIALRSKDGGAELARLLAPAGVPMWATDDVQGAAARIANLRRGALVLVDTPALPAQMSADPFVSDALGAELRILGVDQVHLALPAVLAGEVARDLLAAACAVGADRLAVTHSDATARVGMAIELAVEAGLPISYLADSTSVRPAAAEDLAYALLP